MHVDIAAGDERHPALRADLHQRGQTPVIAAVAQQLDRDPDLAGETPGKPAQLLWRRPRRRQPQDEALFEPRGLELGTCERVLPLAGRAPAAGDEAAQPSVAAPVDGERDQLEPADQAKLRADDELQAPVLGRHVRTHHAGDRALVGDRERRIAE